MNICWRATAALEEITNMVMRATIDTEEAFGPDFQLTVQHNGYARMYVSRWPVLSIVSAKYATSSALPPQWTAIAANQCRAEHPSLGLNGTVAPDSAGAGPGAILVAPGYIDWYNGRGGYLLQLTYLNGWPHAGIDQVAAVGATSVHVDDITGWTGVRGTILDGGNREVVTCTAVTPDTSGDTSGPGTLTITPALKFTHTPSAADATTSAGQTILISSLPESIQLAAIYLAAEQALVRGATAITVQAARGAIQSGGGTRGPEAWHQLAEELLVGYRRVI